MKINCKKADLAKGVQTVLKAVPAKSNLKIQECILIEAEDSAIYLTGNDLELGIKTEVSGTVEQTGSIAVDAKIFSELVRKLPAGEVSIDVQEGQATVKCKKVKFDIAVKSGDEYSRIPVVEKDESIILSEFDLKEAIRQTIFSISDNESNKMMTGELFEISKNKLRIISLDGHRVSIRNLTLEEEYKERKVIVPGKTLTEISKIIGNDPDLDVEIYFTKDHILFDLDETIAVSRLIDGDYFNIEGMIPKDHEIIMEISKKDFQECIDRATLLLKEKTNKPIIMDIGEADMELKVETAVGSMSERLEITKEGKKMLIGFNPKYLLDMLKVIDEEKVSLYMTKPNAPCIVRDEEKTYLYLVLPVNISKAA